MRENLGDGKYKEIVGSIKTVGDEKRVMIEQFIDKNKAKVRREICGILTRNPYFKKDSKDPGSQNAFVEKVTDDEGNERFIPIKGIIQLITSDNRNTNKLAKSKKDINSHPTKVKVDSSDLRGPIGTTDYLGKNSEMCERYVDESGDLHERIWDEVKLGNPVGVFNDNKNFHELTISSSGQINRRKLTGDLGIIDNTFY